MTDSTIPSGSVRKIDTTYWLAVLAAFFVTILWSSSFVIIKFGLVEIPPLIFAGLRYILAAIILLSASLAIPSHRKEIRTLPKIWWRRLIIYGLVYYTITMGTQFIGLALLPALTVSFILNFTTILVVIFAFFVLQETPNRKQIILVFIALLGAYFYFWPVDILTSSLFGILVVVISLVANALAAIIGRGINRSQEISALVVTAISMTIGAIFLLVAGFITTPIIVLSPWGIITILWLAIVNTALAFTLWNKAMQRLSALETTIINSTMLAQIAILALFFLGEIPTLIDWIGILLVMVAAMLIPLLRTRKAISTTKKKEYYSGIGK
ncbi:MAG: DMT family transporter [Candidatus Thorarchaeota archaeon]